MDCRTGDTCLFPAAGQVVPSVSGSMSSPGRRESISLCGESVKAGIPLQEAVDQNQGDPVPGVVPGQAAVGEGEQNLDADLVARAQAGEVDAFRQLVERYQQRVFILALSVMGNHEDARDVIQEAFLKAYKKLSSFRGQSSFYTWLYRIVFNLAIDEKRKRYRTLEMSVGETSSLDASAYGNEDKSVGTSLISPSSNPEHEFHRAELRQHLQQGIQSLSPDHRAVILLREVDGLSYDEISKVVGCNKGTVMSRLHHARKRLQKYLRTAFSEHREGRRAHQGLAKHERSSESGV